VKVYENSGDFSSTASVCLQAPVQLIDRFDVTSFGRLSRSAQRCLIPKWSMMKVEIDSTAVNNLVVNSEYPLHTKG